MNDILEQLEDAAELRLEKATKGMPEGKFRCFCGDVADLESVMPISDSPYAIPVCPGCFGAATKQPRKRVPKKPWERS